MNNTYWYQLITLFSEIAQGIGALVTAYIACKEVPRLVKEYQNSKLMSNFEIEFELYERKARLNEIREENKQYAIQLEAGHDGYSQKGLEAKDSQYNEALEDYLNVFDRLCYYILKNRLSDDDFKTQFRDALRQDIDGFSKYFSSPATPYKNMIQLHQKWSSE